MSQTSEALFRLGDQFRQGFNERGQNYLDVANLGLKKTQMERQSKLDEMGMPALKLGKITAEHGLSQAAKLDEPFNPGELMGSMGSFEMAVSADKSGSPGLERLGKYAFKATYDPNKNAFMKNDGTFVTNREAMAATPVVKQWYMMNFSPYRGARTSRDELALTLSGVGANHPDAPVIQQKIQQYDSLMKNPEWKLQSLEQIKSFVSQLPDDPFDDKKNNLARIENEMAIVRGELSAMANTAHAKELKGLEISAADKRSALDRQNRLESARIRSGASENKFNKGEVEYQDQIAKNKILGSFGLRVDLNGNPVGQVTETQLAQMKQIANQMGYDVYAMPGEKADKPGWFTGDEQMYQVTGVNRIDMPGSRGGGQVETMGLNMPTSQPQATQPKILTGPAAAKRAKELLGQINAGKIDEKQLLDSLLASGQNALVMNIASELEKKQLLNDQKAKPPGPQKTRQQLRDEEEQRRREQVLKEREALKKPTDWNAIYRSTNRNVR